MSRKPFHLVALLAVLGSASVVVAAPVTGFFTDRMNPNSALRGLHINRASSDRTPHGISLDLDGVPVWDLGIDYESPDLVLAFSHTTKSDQIRLRPDTGQMDLGPIVGHPVTQNQLNVTAGTAQNPLDGVGVGCYGSRSGLYLYQKLPGTGMTKINFNRLFQVGTDFQQRNTPDFNIYNNLTGQTPLKISPVDHIVMGYGATVGRTFHHTGKTLGFYSARPITRPVITGSRSDGTALRNLLSQLHTMGLIVDSTTP